MIIVNLVIIIIKCCAIGRINIWEFLRFWVKMWCQIYLCDMFMIIGVDLLVFNYLDCTTIDIKGDGLT